MNPYKELEIGAQAEKVFRTLEGRLDEIEENIKAEWEGSAVGEYEGREQCWMMLKAVKELRRSYTDEIDTGKLAQAQLEAEQNG